MGAEHDYPMCEVAIAAIMAATEGNDEETLSKFTPEQLKKYKKLKLRYKTIEQIERNDPLDYFEEMLLEFIISAYNLDWVKEGVKKVEYVQDIDEDKFEQANNLFQQFKKA